MIATSEQAPNKNTRLKKISLITVFVFIIAGFLILETVVIPVQSATSKDWNQQTFWYEPWGKSGVHKGIDIFAPKGQPVISATQGIVLYSGEISLGGKVLLILGPKWRLHYYAHLEQSNV